MNQPLPPDEQAEENVPLKTRSGAGSRIRRDILILTATVAVFSIAALSMISYQVFFSSLLQKEVELLGTTGIESAARFRNELEHLRKDVLYLSGTPPIRGIMNAISNEGYDVQGKSSLGLWRERLAVLFTQMMRVNPSYLQVRFIEAQHSNKELVRVDRTGDDTFRIVPSEELQDKSNENYFIETAKRSIGEVYVSNFNLNRERGVIEVPHKPVFRVATPIFSEQGKLFGMIVINESAVSFLDQFKNSNPNRQSYLIDYLGRYLVHADPRKSFQFEYETTAGAQKENPVLFERIQAISRSDKPHQLVSFVGSNAEGKEQAFNLSLVSLDEQDPFRFITLVNSSSTQPIIERLDQLRNKIFLIGFIILVISVLWSFKVSVAITKPIQSLKASIVSFGRDKTLYDLPTEVRGEIGSLARAFKNMAYQVEHEIAERRSAEFLFRSVIDLSPSGLLMVDSQGKIVLVNSQIQSLFGYTMEELLNQPLETLLPKAIRDKHKENVRSFVTKGAARAMGEGRDLEGCRKDGSYLPVEVGLAPVEIRGERCVLAAVNDITYRKEAEEQLQEINDELQRSNEDLESFAYVASHDLKAPLQAIQKLIRMIAEDSETVLSEGGKKKFELLKNRSERMKRLLESLLEYSRAGREKHLAEIIHTSQFARELVELIHPPETFVIEIDEALPTITAYKAPLQKVFMNLISNAIKHHDREKGVIRLSVAKVNCDNDMVEFTIVDDGPGIPEKYQEQIFEMFQTLKPRDQVEGSGMGLAIVKKTVESLGGSIRVESTEGRGTTFRFTLPRSV
ncbi:ATP-binding protein [Oligoflexia bacterium]|nr:ATP-binding protein [Oligoflexia bacterium]